MAHEEVISVSAKLRTVSLTRAFNERGSLRTKATKTRPAWHESIAGLVEHMARGRETVWGIPFRLGPRDLSKKGLIVLADGLREVELPLRGRATHVCVLHFCDVTEDMAQNTAGGELLAEYVLRYADGSEHVTPIRRRFEVNAFSRP